MNIQPITPTVPACYGVLCPLHADCQRYHAVEQAGKGYYFAIYMCSETDERPLFVERVSEAA